MRLHLNAALICFFTIILLDLIHKLNAFLLPAIFRWIYKHDDSPIVGDRDDCITHSDGHNQMTTEGESLFIYLPYSIFLC